MFACADSAGRCRMAAALLDRHAHGQVTIHCAGPPPTGEIDPAVATAMREIGLDPSRRIPPPPSTDTAHIADVVIALGCDDACPDVKSKRFLDWQVDNPAGRSIEEIRAIRDAIDRRVQALLAELETPS
ncbi:phosphotyrosine protein phosphatase [Streptomyces sp. NPDC048385]|uniref:arsenate-mycothiol transferase ArsC n=1 Tax=unclassified Streptomyces TaxID=2593676 RepID=UPI0034380702